MALARSYSNPPLMLSGSLPVQNPGAGRLVPTFSAPFFWATEAPAPDMDTPATSPATISAATSLRT
jgi:hypothetical protein